MPAWAREKGYRLSDRDSNWICWQERTGELPPDFSRMPSRPFLPDPLVLEKNGPAVPVTDLQLWDKKKQQVKEDLTHWMTGSFPDPPRNLTAGILTETSEKGVRVRMVELRFGPGKKARMTCEIFIPPGKGPFPVFMTQWNHRDWAQVALRRGYIGCVYAGADARDDTEEYQNIWPEHDFSCLMRRAWGAHRVVDYLYTLSFVDTNRIAITGHSRNSKQSIMAAFFDRRIDALVTSSGGTGGATPFRFTDARYDNETIDEICGTFPHWFHPRLRFFAGREHKLPFDQNLVLSFIAPRPLVINSALTESQGNPFALEQCYESVRKAYRFRGAEENLAIRLRYGWHSVSSRDIEAYVDFLDNCFYGRRLFLDTTHYYPYDYHAWQRNAKEITPPPEEAALVSRTEWLLGDEPPGISPLKQEQPEGNRDHMAELTQIPEIPGSIRLIMGPYRAPGDYLRNYLYCPAGPDGRIMMPENGKLPVVVLLHEYAYATGFARGSESFVNGLLQEGFAVLCFDFVGMGTRIEEGMNFYDRYPRWSKMGKMVEDTRAAIAAAGELEITDPDRIYVCGYSLGGTVGIFAAALDERVNGLAVSGAFTPFRDPEGREEHGGLEVWSHLHGLLPRLGPFADHPENIPVDFPEILGSLAPRPLLIIAPRYDRHISFEKVRQATGRIQQAYGDAGHAENVRAVFPETFDGFAQEHQEGMIGWLREQAQKPQSHPEQ